LVDAAFAVKADFVIETRASSTKSARDGVFLHAGGSSTALGLPRSAAAPCRSPPRWARLLRLAERQVNFGIQRLDDDRVHGTAAIEGLFHDPLLDIHQEAHKATGQAVAGEHGFSPWTDQAKAAKI